MSARDTERNASEESLSGERRSVSESGVLWGDTDAASSLSKMMSASCGSEPVSNQSKKVRRACVMFPWSIRAMQAARMGSSFGGSVESMVPSDRWLSLAWMLDLSVMTS